jgi:predicted site-specific integrase-resolvase
MKLSEWARRQGINYQTAHRWFHQGVLPVEATQLSTGTILVRDEPAAAATGVALYARVSSSDQKGDLDRQLARLVQYATEQDMAVTKTVTEVASGMNPRRSKLLRLLKDPTIGTIVVEHRERLARFGTEYLEAALSASGRQLRVVEEGELKDDLVRDMIDVLTSFCARLYGRRSARKRAKRAMAAVEED